MPTSGRHVPNVLSIAGSDSGGGAGIQADLKAFAACGVHGMTVITAVTAQNTVGVSAIHPIPPDVIVEQARMVVSDIGVAAVKIGMLGTVETIDAVAEILGMLDPAVPVVLDPVMISESGAALLAPEAIGHLIATLFPRVTVVTPNLPEARALVGHQNEPEEGAEVLASAIFELGPEVVVITGGHREVTSDLYFDGSRSVEIPGERHADGAAHGSGCTHSSVLAARLAWGDQALVAARVAKELASRAIADGLRGVGAGAGPVNVLGIGKRPSAFAAD